MATKKYLDYAGLKRVLAKLLPGARKIWHGTLAEWEALPAAEKAKYDQAEVIDEYTGVPVVVDKVESGNLNPVTSNAVAEATKVIRLTPTKTANVGTVYDAEFLRIGRLVSINVNFVVNSGTLYTGLPKPMSRQLFAAAGYSEKDLSLRLQLKTDGSLELDNVDSAIINASIAGHLVYITAEGD